jgi:aminopeptidase N
MPLLHDHTLCGCRHASLDGFASAQAPRHYPPDLSIEPVHMDIRLHVEVDAKRATGQVTHTLAINTPGARELVLHAVALDIYEVVDAGDVKVAWRHDGELLTITWPEGLTAGQERSLTIRYSVERPDSGLFFSAPDAAYPKRARWACTDHETERARHWLPCVDLPQVRCKLDFHLRADKHFTILANGELIDEQPHEDGVTKTAHWSLDWPCPSYITCFALGEFSTFEDGSWQDKPLAYFAASEHTSEDLERTFGRTRDMLEWLTGKLDCALPYPKYFQFALPGIGGAMENISLVSWDDVFVMDETLATEWTWLIDQINIHEMAHSYFGDAIVCRDFAHAWLKESWATYIESCWLEHRHGEDELLYDFHRNMYSYFTEADTSYKRPIVTNVYETSWHMYDRHLYPGGGARLHMLRRQLGDEVFWAGVQDYVKNNLGKAVETHDFRVALERRSGKSLVRWFDQWIHSAGYPHVEVKYAWDAKKNEARFSITQKQVKEDARLHGSRHEVDPVFVMDLELGWRVDGVDHHSTLTLNRRTHEHVVKMDANPEMVRVDPDNKLVMKLDFNPGDDLLTTQLERAPDVIGRILAAKELIALHKPKHIARVLAHYEKESFWGVRQQIVQALAKSTLQPALDALVSLCAVERDGLVLESLVRALGAFKDEQVVGTLLGMLDRGLPYRARMAAYEVLGAQREQAPYELLVERAQRRTFGHFPQSGALKGLALTRRAESLDVLIKVSRRIHDAQPHRVRAAACRGIGELATYLDEPARERAIDHLTGMLRDADQEVGSAASYALISARALGARGAVLSFAKTLAHQDRVDLERAVGGLTASKESARIKQLEGELETLRKAQRDLRERVDKLDDK